MIKREDINKAVGGVIDQALIDAGIPAVRRRSDDDSQIHRRSVQVMLEGLHVEPMGQLRKLTQDIEIYFYPADIDQPRDDVWTAVNALEQAFADPLIIESAALYCDDEIYYDMSDDFAQISLSLSWMETAHIDAETIEEINVEVE